MRTKRRSKMMTTKGVATMLNVHIDTVRRWSDQGILKGYRASPRGYRKFARDEIVEVLASRQFGHNR